MHKILITDPKMRTRVVHKARRFVLILEDGKRLRRVVSSADTDFLREAMVLIHKTLQPKPKEIPTPKQEKKIKPPTKPKIKSNQEVKNG